MRDALDLVVLPRGQAALTVAMLKGTYLAKRSRLSVERISQILRVFPTPPAGLTLGITGSAAVGRDMNTASNESLHNTTTATIVLVVGILLIVYRSPLLALIPLVTIALSVWTSLMGIAWLSVTTVASANTDVLANWYTGWPRQRNRAAGCTGAREHSVG